MCLIVFAWKQHTRAPLLLGANRDEFHGRPTAPAAFWTDYPDILAGRDLQAGGTWLGISRQGRFAAITNIRDPERAAAGAARSRGELCRDFLAGDAKPQEYLSDVGRRATSYQGFNLIVGDGETLWYLRGSDAQATPTALAPGVYGLSNDALDVPWPKVQLAKAALMHALEDGNQVPSSQTLRQCLASRELMSEHALHEPRLNGAMAQRLSAQFIVSPDYGTRCTSTLRYTENSKWEFSEARYDADGRQAGLDCFTVTTSPAS